MRSVLKASTALLFLLPASSLAQSLSTSFAPSISFLPNRQPTTVSVPVVITLAAAAPSGNVTGSNATVASGGSAIGNGTAAVITTVPPATTTSATSTLPTAPATTIIAGTYTAPSPGATINGQQIGPNDSYIAAGRMATEIGSMLAVTVVAVGLGLQYLV
ncbi:hypothetical protein FRB96_004613 [Tulasnella sp. 330]|nr:hypothetical protein FRB96_004613 [Tulasnella sp. 330]KAG8870611.1 hypothetical protein FRB97_009584 [Tulasnella sp. 331]KAG8873255.1 hypothetical protein FRB98_009133 [Tulasnella sp. 332]